MKPIEIPSDFRIIAHRGASGYAPENTMSAFALAKELGATEVELDTQLSTDGIVVICHDTTLERYGHGTAIVEELSSEVLLQFDMGSWFSPEFRGERIPTLEQLFARFERDFVYHIELKGMVADLPQSVHDVAERMGVLENSIFTSFSLDQLVRMREVSKHCRLGWLVVDEHFDERIYQKARELELFQLCPRVDVITETMVRAGHSLVEEIRVWGLKGEPRHVRDLVRRAVDSGCDGMTINWPDWAKNVVT